MLLAASHDPLELMVEMTELHEVAFMDINDIQFPVDVKVCLPVEAERTFRERCMRLLVEVRISCLATSV